MLQVNNLSLSFGGQKILDDISFNVHSGERIGLVGRNGSGKTSIFRLITGELHPDEGRIAIPKNYTVKLTNSIKKADKTAAFTASNQDGYEWTFEVSTEVDLTPPKVVSVCPV